MMTRHFRSAGFTLIELLAGIGIIATLSFLTAGWFSTVKDRGRNIACVSNLRNILVGVNSYVADRNGMLWSRDELGYSRFRMANDPLGLPKILEDYVSDQRVWLCPAGRKSLKKFGNNYTWTVASKFETESVYTGSGTKTLLIWDAYNFSLPSMFGASEDHKGDGTSPSGPSSLNSKYHLRPHSKNTSVNWGFLDGHVISGATAKQ